VSERASSQAAKHAAIRSWLPDREDGIASVIAELAAIPLGTPPAEVTAVLRASARN
jgi:hypothetical protein